MDADKPPLRIAICGLGVVGRSVVELLAERGESIGRRVGRELQLRCVATRRELAAYTAGLGSPARQSLAGVRCLEGPNSPLAAAALPDIDVVVELLGGVGAAKSLAEQTLLAGKSLVTANKQLIAEHGDDLLALAERHGGGLACEASVGGGVPMVKALRESLLACDIGWLWGILNGTGNYVLGRMRDVAGERLDEAVAQAQEKGYAEADPAADIDGGDAACKLAILARLAWGVRFSDCTVRRQSLRQVTPADMRCARALGCVIKPLALAQRGLEGLALDVGPGLLAATHPAAAATGADNYLAVGDRQGVAASLAGPGAGGPPTASAVLADLADLAAGHRPVWPRPAMPPATAERSAPPRSPLPSGHYWRLALDGPDALDSVLAGLREAGLRVAKHWRSQAPADSAGPGPRRRRPEPCIAALLSEPAPPECVARADASLSHQLGARDVDWLRWPALHIASQPAPAVAALAEPMQPISDAGEAASARRAQR